MLIDQIHTDIIAAMKARDGVRLTTLRNIKLKLDAFTKEKKNNEAITPTEEQKILEGLVKQRQDSIEQFTKGNRMDLVATESVELAIIKSYMPQDATEEELDAAITSAMSMTMKFAGDPKSIGTIMKNVKAALAEKRVDGKILSDKIKARFTTPA